MSNSYTDKICVYYYLYDFFKYNGSSRRRHELSHDPPVQISEKLCDMSPIKPDAQKPTTIMMIYTITIQLFYQMDSVPEFHRCHLALVKAMGKELCVSINTSCYIQWRSQPDNLVMLCKFEIIIHFFRN